MTEPSIGFAGKMKEFLFKPKNIFMIIIFIVLIVTLGLVINQYLNPSNTVTFVLGTQAATTPFPTTCSLVTPHPTVCSLLTPRPTMCSLVTPQATTMPIMTTTPVITTPATTQAVTTPAGTNIPLAAETQTSTPAPTK